MIKLQPCPKLRERSADQIASFLIRKYSEEKSKDIVKEFSNWGFTKESLMGDENKLFQFLVLVAYDRYPFVPYEIVWERNDRKSAFSVLKRNGLFNLNKVRRSTEDELNHILRQCVIRKDLHLHNTNPKNERMGTRFPRTIKELSQKIDRIMKQLKEMRSGLDVLRLHHEIESIHGFGPTTAAKFIMYTIRDMGIGDIHPSQLDLVAKHLVGEWHNRKWVRRLEDPSLGGKPGLLQEIMENLKDDPMAIDYFFTLDRYYCSKGRCKECEL